MKPEAQLSCLRVESQNLPSLVERQQRGRVTRRPRSTSADHQVDAMVPVVAVAINDRGVGTLGLRSPAVIESPAHNRVGALCASVPTENSIAVENVVLATRR